MYQSDAGLVQDILVIHLRCDQPVGRLAHYAQTQLSMRQLIGSKGWLGISQTWLINLLCLRR